MRDMKRKPSPKPKATPLNSIIVQVPRDETSLHRLALMEQIVTAFRDMTRTVNRLADAAKPTVIISNCVVSGIPAGGTGIKVCPDPEPGEVLSD